MLRPGRASARGLRRHIRRRRRRRLYQRGAPSRREACRRVGRRAVHGRTGWLGDTPAGDSTISVDVFDEDDKLAARATVGVVSSPASTRSMTQAARRAPPRPHMATEAIGGPHRCQDTHPRHPDPPGCSAPAAWGGDRDRHPVVPTRSPPSVWPRALRCRARTPARSSNSAMRDPRIGSNTKVDLATRPVRVTASDARPPQHPQSRLTYQSVTA